MENWHGFNISERKEKLRKCFESESIGLADEFPVLVNTPTYFGYGNNMRSTDYWTDPKTMLDFQTKGFEHHLSHIRDDTVPYFMPWFGTGVLASAFGCKMKNATGDGDDPAVYAGCIHELKDIGKLRLPDPYRDGWMPRVLHFMDYARKNGDLPVGPTDLNSPLCTAAQMCGYDKLFFWMYDEPNFIHDLMDIVTDAFIHWVKVQKEHAGEQLTSSNGLQGVWSPEGVGVWMSDDDLVSVNADLYEEFIVPRYSRIFKAFGGGSLHYCGKGNHQLANFKKIEGLRVINNSPMGDFDTLAALVENRPKGVAIQIQDTVPLDPTAYYNALFDHLHDLNGVMVATWVLDKVAMLEKGGYCPVEWNSDEVANKTVDAIRFAVRKKLEGYRL